ncbi:MAG: hypothetical protein ACYC8V_13655 [Caulobacteraceae bacterium]
MRTRRALALIPLACLAIGGCKFGKPAAKAPTGQVVARVEGQEITLRDLQAEMAGASFPDAKTRKLAEEQALQNIISRKILADEARKEGLDKTPDFALQKERTTDALLAQTLQNKVVASVPPPTREEADRFVADHPDIFAQRKIFTVDQIRFARPNDPAILNALAPLKTMDEVKAFLDADHIESSRDAANLDAVGADPRLIDAIMKLPPNEVFVIPSGQTILVNQIVATRVVPYTGEAAVNYATLLLRRQHAQQAVQRQFGLFGAKAKPSIAINKDYRPAPPPTAGPAAPGASPAKAAAPSGKGA